ncbi:hypothetical protein [Levilactobacillus brevis]|uniref:hypothetical protein n=1 Tax=Levilactobacillus brevis TaxID=1580 RepID=UPI000A206BA6|nr:hypothetical protein [Levilactobacillus brevis]ARN89377.1 hypothetical protein AZI09_01790 [Levilactobacillus brevis]ARN96952.1 hypothetical protein AZI10_01765 [Levilactobacillus brevis]
MNALAKKVIELSLPVILLSFPAVIMGDGVIRFLQHDNMNPDVAVALSGIMLLAISGLMTLIYGISWYRHRSTYLRYRWWLCWFYGVVALVALLMVCLAATLPEWLMGLIGIG